MNRFLLMAITIAIGIPIALSEVTDVQLRGILGRAVSYIDDPDGGPGEVRYAISQANGNTNRVVSLMKQMVDEGLHWKGSECYFISEIGKLGTEADLPFLYQKVGATNYSETAVVAVLSIEGLTTNSLARLNALLPDERVGCWDGVHAWFRILDEAGKSPGGSYVRCLAISNAITFASRQTESVESFDRCLTRIDPTYRLSKRRLAVLRSVRDLGANEWQTNFVTRAIRELESYPEDNLSE